MKILLASISLLLTSSAGLAAEPAATARLTTAQVIANAERLELARQFVALSQPAGDILDMIRESALYAASEQLGPDADDATRAEVEQNVDRVLAKFTPKFEAQRPAILDAYAQAYARQFTTEELRVLVAFGSSAAGKHFLASTVDIETDPRYGPTGIGWPGQGDPSVSKASSSFAKDAAKDQPDPGWVSALPSAQKCG